MIKYMIKCKPGLLYRCIYSDRLILIRHINYGYEKPRIHFLLIDPTLKTISMGPNNSMYDPYHIIDEGLYCYYKKVI